MRVWPDCPDEVLLKELSVIVSAGWELPQRTGAWPRIRHLSLLVPPADALRPAQAAQRLLQVVDETLANADEETLSRDDATGCRILLGTHPTYRTVASPVERRRAAGDLLVATWHASPPSDPGGTFQRRHQENALRLVLGVLRERFVPEPDPDPYDVARIERWYEVGAQRQIVAYGETAYYRILRDGLDSIQMVESEPAPDGLISSALAVKPVNGRLVSTAVALDPTLPGFRRIDINLNQTYSAGDIVRLEWSEQCEYGPNTTDWGRLWVTINILNDGCEVQLILRFANEAELADLCWWIEAEPIVDLGEVGPKSPHHVFDVKDHRAAIKTWSAAETERRRLYGMIWCWFDDESPGETETGAATEAEA